MYVWYSGGDGCGIGGAESVLFGGMSQVLHYGWRSGGDGML